MLPAQPNQSLIDGIACLQALTAQAEPIGGRALSRALGLEPTRTHRLLRTLAHLGLVRQTPERKYAPGPAIHVLSAQSLFASGLIRRALGPLEALHVHGHIVAMGVLWQTQVCYVYFAPPGTGIAAALGSRAPHPASRSGIGLALLAGLADDEIRQRYTVLGAPGYSDVDALLAAVDGVRRQGYALRQVSDEDARRVTVAVPVGSPPYAAVGLSGAIGRAGLAALVAALRQAAAAMDASPQAGARESAVG